MRKVVGLEITNHWVKAVQIRYAKGKWSVEKSGKKEVPKKDEEVPHSSSFAQNFGGILNLRNPVVVRVKESPQNHTETHGRNFP